jgi:hypothetical protein
MRDKIETHTEALNPLKLWNSFNILRTTLINQNSIHEEIKNRLKSGNARCLPVQNLLYSGFLSESVKINIFRTIILAAVFHCCKTWLLTLREKYRLRVFENRVLRRIFKPKRNEVTGEWRIQHNKELYALYTSQDVIRVIKSKRQVGRTCSTYGTRRGGCRVSVGKPEGRRQLERPRRRLEDNIKMYVR